MEPIKFPEQNRVWAENQPPYLPLPAFVNESETISCWALSWRERWLLLWSGRLWLRQMNFGKPLQPQCAQITSPFTQVIQPTPSPEPEAPQ